MTLHRFKAAFDPPSVELGSFSLLIGRNGSGKSTVLEVFSGSILTLRRDAREASERYRGVLDVVNLRSQTKPPYFAVELEWKEQKGTGVALRYQVKVEADSDAAPRIVEETLVESSGARGLRDLIRTDANGRELVQAA